MTFFIIYMLLNLPRNVNIWTASWYTVDYSLGIGSRFFIGAFLHLFSPDFISNHLAYRFCIISYLMMAAIISFCCDIVIKKTSSSYREVTIYLMLLYIASPFSINSYLSYVNFGRLEAHTLLLMILSIIIFFNVKNYWIKYILITFLTCISVAIYQGYIFLYYPMILITIMVSLLTMPKINIKELVGPICNIMSTCLTFIYFQFFSYVKFHNVKEFSETLQKMTDMPFDEIEINNELFRSITYTYNHVMIPYLTYRNPRDLLEITLLIFLPLVIIFYHIFRTAWKTKKATKWYKNEYVYCLLVNLAILPQFILNIDWGRWLIAIGTMLFFEIFLLVYIGNKGIIKALIKMNTFIKQYYLLCIILIVYLAKLQSLSTTEILPDALNLYNNIIGIYR